MSSLSAIRRRIGTLIRAARKMEIIYQKPGNDNSNNPVNVTQ
jgi:hypothetical protein